MKTPVLFQDVNRAVLIISYKKPFLDWLDQSCKAFADDFVINSRKIPTTGFGSRLVYLIPYIDGGKEKYDAIIKDLCDTIFNQILDGWLCDESTWPENRSWVLFNAWFAYEVQTDVCDLSGITI